MRIYRTFVLSLFVSFLAACTDSRSLVGGDASMGALDFATSTDGGTSDGGGVSDAGTSGGGGGATGFKCSGANPDFGTQVEPILAGNCSSSECHRNLMSMATSPFFKQVGAGCTDGRRVVQPGDPEHSYIIDKLTDHDLCSGVPMPKNLFGTWRSLPSNNIQTIYDWICQGAKNN